MKKSKTTIDNIKERKQNVNEKHIQFYDKTLSTLEFILDEYSREMTRADIEFLDMPKNYVAVLDFLISSIVTLFALSVSFVNISTIFARVSSDNTF